MTAVTFELRGNATVAWQKGPRHKFYEDRFRLLCHPIPLIAQANRGEIFAVLDGVGSAPKGMASAQEVCDSLVRFFTSPIDQIPDEKELLNAILANANETINSWGCMEGTTRPDGACAGTIVWIDVQRMAHIFHAGDTTALLIRDGLAQVLTTVHQNGDGHLSNYFGMPTLQLQTQSLQLEEGDRLLIFSDGIGKAFANNQGIADIIESKSTRNASLAALFVAARASGSSDDATAILVDIEDVE